MIDRLTALIHSIQSSSGLSVCCVVANTVKLWSPLRRSLLVVRSSPSVRDWWSVDVNGCQREEKEITWDDNGDDHNGKLQEDPRDSATSSKPPCEKHWTSKRKKVSPFDAQRHSELTTRTQDENERQHEIRSWKTWCFCSLCLPLAFQMSFRVMKVNPKRRACSRLSPAGPAGLYD